MKRWTMFLLFEDHSWSEYTLFARTIDDASEQAILIAAGFPISLRRTWFVQPA